MDWSQIINDMVEAGQREVDIALYCQTSSNAIHKIKTGKTKQPYADIGLKLVELHKKIMKANKPKLQTLDQVDIDTASHSLIVQGDK